MPARYAVHVHLARDVQASRQSLNPELVTDLIWARADPAQYLDHVRTLRTDHDDGLDLLIILRAHSTQAALDQAAHLCAKALTTTVLHGWSPTAITTLDLADLTP